MVITGSAIFIQPGAASEVIEHLSAFPEVTYHVSSESGTELVVNLEADNVHELEVLCERLRETIPEIVEITHIYVNFEDEVEKMKAGGSHVPTESDDL